MLADDGDRAAVELAEAGHDRVVVGAAAVAVELGPVVQKPLDVVERVRPVLMPGELDRPPDVLVGRLLGEPRELSLELVELRRQAGAAEQAHAAQPGQPLAEP